MTTTTIPTTAAATNEMAPQIAYAICRQVLDDVSNPAVWARALRARPVDLADVVVKAAGLDESDRQAILRALIRAQWRACFFQPAIHGRQPTLAWHIRAALQAGE